MTENQSPKSNETRGNLTLFTITLAIAAAVLVGCGSAPEKKKDDFFTSGSREADQRAAQRIAKDQQLSESKPNEGKGTSGQGIGGAEQVEGRQTLFERLGGEAGIKAIVEDFTPRVIQDPRVNWDRQGVKRGWLLNRETAPVWRATPETLARFKKHMAQFLALATGGPARYEGKEMKAAHQGMQITNSEFDAAIGDLKASLDRLKIADGEQKELLAVIESTRPQVVTER